MGLGLFAEGEADDVAAAVQEVVAAAVELAEDFEGPLVEHQAQKMPIMLAASLAIAEDHEILLAVGAEKVVEVDRGDGE